MNHLLIGTADKTERLLEIAQKPFLLIDDGPVADAFVERFPKAKQFDLTRDHFNPLNGMTYRKARDFAETLYTASPQGENTLTVRNGKRALTRLLMRARRLDQLNEGTEPGDIEAKATVDDMLLSPVLAQVLCTNTDFFFRGSIIAKLDRAVIGDYDAFILGTLLIGQFQGQVIVPDFGFYGRDLHISLIRQNRLVAGLYYLSSLPRSLQQEVLLIKDKVGDHCTYEDAVTLAQYAGLIPDTVAHTEFVQNLVA